MGAPGILRHSHIRLSIVAARGYQHRLRKRCRQGVLFHLGAAVAAEGHVDHVGAIFDRVKNALGNVCCRQNSGILGRLDRHDLGVVSNANDAKVVICCCRDNTGRVCPMTVIVAWITE